jgi:hypothetical protein
MHGMALTDDLARRIEKKRQEIAMLEQQLMAAKAYVQAMDEALKLAERINAPVSVRDTGVNTLRKGSLPAMAYPVLRGSGRPLYLTTLLEGMGVPTTAKNKRALASSLSAYARRGDIFTRPQPNTFGLVEFGGGPVGVDAVDDGTPALLKMAR